MMALNEMRIKVIKVYPLGNISIHSVVGKIFQTLDQSVESDRHFHPLLPNDASIAEKAN